MIPHDGIIRAIFLRKSQVVQLVFHLFTIDGSHIKMRVMRPGTSCWNGLGRLEFSRVHKAGAPPLLGWLGRV